MDNRWSPQGQGHPQGHPLGYAQGYTQQPPQVQPPPYSQQYSLPTLLPAPQNCMTSTPAVPLQQNSLPAPHSYGPSQAPAQPQQYRQPTLLPAPQNDWTSIAAVEAANQNHHLRRFGPPPQYSLPAILPNPFSGRTSTAVAAVAAAPALVEVEDQTEHLWYWIEIIKTFTFHDGTLSTPNASSLASFYISKLPQPHNILPDAQISTTLTLLSESSSLLNYQILGILFPLLRRWTSQPSFTALIQSTRGYRPHRLAYWRQRAIAEPVSFHKFIEVLDTMLNRKWVFGSDAPGDDMERKALRRKMQGYLMWKFVLSADVVFTDLIMRLGIEEYNKERFHGVHYLAMLPKLMAINQDPNIIPFLVAPALWPSVPHVDEEVLNRCLALMGSTLG